MSTCLRAQTPTANSQMKVLHTPRVFLFLLLGRHCFMLRSWGLLRKTCSVVITVPRDDISRLHVTLVFPCWRPPTCQNPPKHAKPRRDYAPQPRPASASGVSLPSLKVPVRIGRCSGLLVTVQPDSLTTSPGARRNPTSRLRWNDF